MGDVFFCDKILSKEEANVEHLVAKANGGSDSDENCVVCCRVVNTFLGNLSIKEKMRVVLNQKGDFKCPGVTAAGKVEVKPAEQNNSTAEQAPQVIKNLEQQGQSKCSDVTAANKAEVKPSTPPSPPASPNKAEIKPAAQNNSQVNITAEQISQVIKNLEQRGQSKPRRVETLKSTIAALFSKSLSENQLDAMVKQLQARGKVVINGNNISYKL